MAYMRAVDICGGKGGADALFINDRTPKSTAATGQAVVRIKAFGLNRMDLLQREGHYPVPPQAPATMGVEFSGVVESIGGGDSGDDDGDDDAFAVGDAVFGLAYGGAYAEYVAVSTRTLVHKPAYLSWHEAAGLPETWMTALQALHEVGEFGRDTDKGDKGDKGGPTALWHAAASGVSIAGIQLARLAGASAVFATAGSDAKCAFAVDELGATAAFNYKTQPAWGAAVTRAVKEHGGSSSSSSNGSSGNNGIDLVVDYVGAAYFQQNLDVAALDGRIVCLALLSGAVLPAGVDISAILRKRLRIEGSSLRSRDVAYQGRLRDRLAAVLPEFAPDRRRLRVFVDRVFPWTQIRQAHEYMEADVSMGKIICTVDDE